jgi:short-subunit dehydrogenase
MNIVFFGASSQIAKGLIKLFAKKDHDDLKLFIRDQLILKKWIDEQGFKKNCSMYHFDQCAVAAVKVVAQKFLKK